MIAFALLIVFIAVVVVLNKDKIGQNHNTGNNNNQAVISEQHQDIYVPALGRDVPWSTQYDSYYDQQTDCYFFLNTEMDPPIWQYWFEGVSSQYGDYGWLEWDAKESRWYVQKTETKWELLPEKYASDLWHFDS